MLKLKPIDKRFSENLFNEWTKGFDSFFIGSEKLWEELHDFFDIQQNIQTFPPYNLIKTDNSTIIELALAGFKKESIQITLEKFNGAQKLSITGQRDLQQSNEEKNYLHRGIAQRLFTRNFVVYEDSEIEYAKFNDGILQIKVNKLKKEEENKPKLIQIE